MTPADINAKLQQIIIDRCAGKITRQQCVEEMRHLRSLLSAEQLVPSESSGASWPQARPYVRLAPSLTATENMEQSEPSL